MKRYNFLPLSLILYLPLWHTGKALHGSLPYLLNLISYGGIVPVLKQIFSFTPEAIFIALLFFLYTRYAALKVSLLVSSSFLIAISYFFLSPSFFYDNLGLFFIAASLSFSKQKGSAHLFFSLFFLSLLHCFSSLLIGIHYYGYNIPLFFSFLSPITAFYLLMKKDIYPSKITLLTLFPILLFPISFYTHNVLPLSTGTFISTLVSCAAIYILLEKKNIIYTLAVFTAFCLSLLLVESTLLFPYMFTAAALLAHIIQLFYVSRGRLSSHKNKTPRPKRLSLLSLRFYNEHMHY